MNPAFNEDPYSPLPGKGSSGPDESGITEAQAKADPVEFDDMPFREISRALHQGLSRVRDGFRDLSPKLAQEEISAALREVVTAYKLLIRAKSHLSAREKALRKERGKFELRQASEWTLIRETVAKLRCRIDESGKESETLRKALQLPADLVEAIPLGLLVYQYQAPGELFCLRGNPEALRLIEAEHVRGVEFDEMWPNARGQGLTDQLLKTAGTQGGLELDRTLFRRGKTEKIFRLRAFSMPSDRLGISIEDITEKR